MGMTREIQRTLERSLPQYVLDYLNEEFLKREESIAKVKELEAKVEKLLTEIQERDRVLWQAFKNIGTAREIAYNSSPIGFAFGGGNGYRRPDYNLDVPYMRGRGGGRGRDRNEGFSDIYAQRGGSSGGSTGGSSGGSTGGSSGTTAHWDAPFKEEFDPPLPSTIQPIE
jgi:hypothetical protein